MKIFKHYYLSIILSLFSLTLVNCIDESKYDVDRMREKENTDIKKEPIDFSVIQMSPEEKKREEWIRSVRMLEKMEEGDTQILPNGKLPRSEKLSEADLDFIKNSNLFEPTIKLPDNEEFEYSEKWKIEAYKATKEYIKEKIYQQNCKVIAEGYYQSNAARYIGNQSFKVKVYFEFDCNGGYNNPKYFWTESRLNKYGKWSVNLINQQFVD